MSVVMTETELSSPTSTSSSGEFSPRKTDGKASYKKSNKPMMEKKRRARINSSLSQLKTLVLQAMKKDNSQYSKLEKADILELTVRHLKNVQRYQTNSMSQLPDAISKYRAGFNECANEVVRYLGESHGVNDEARTRIISHLASILSPINALPLQHRHTSILPASLQQVQQQPQQPHLQQLHLQQLQNQSMFLTPSSQPLSIDTNNSKTVFSHPAFLASAGSTLDSNYLISGSPTAFQPPSTTGGVIQSGLQLSCITSTAMATTPLQLVPSTLPSGHVALVLAPQTVPTMNLFTAQQGNGTHVRQETVNVQSHGLIRLDSGLTVTDCPAALLAKPSQSHKQDTSSTVSYQQYSLSNQTRQSIDHHSNVLPLIPALQLSNSSVKNSDNLTSSPAANATGISAVSRSRSSIVVASSNNNCGASVVRATSTWRPW